MRRLCGFPPFYGDTPRKTMEQVRSPALLNPSCSSSSPFFFCPSVLWTCCGKQPPDQNRGAQTLSLSVLIVVAEPAHVVTFFREFLTLGSSSSTVSNHSRPPKELKKNHGCPNPGEDEGD